MTIVIHFCSFLCCLALSEAFSKFFIFTRTIKRVIRKTSHPGDFYNQATPTTIEKTSVSRQLFGKNNFGQNNITTASTKKIVSRTLARYRKFGSFYAFVSKLAKLLKRSLFRKTI